MRGRVPVVSEKAQHDRIDRRQRKERQKGKQEGRDEEVRSYRVVPSALRGRIEAIQPARQPAGFRPLACRPPGEDQGPTSIRLLPTDKCYWLYGLPIWADICWFAAARAALGSAAEPER